MKKKHLAILLIINLSFSVCIGQRDFRHGYIITNNHDTLYGYINLKANYQNSRQCEFQRDIGAEAKTFFPNDIFGYKIENNKYYISKEVNLNGNNEKVFLEFLLDGIVDLFYLKELHGEYYFIEKLGILYQLSNETRQVVENNIVHEINSYQYIRILKLLFQDSPTTLKKVETTPFSYKPLIGISKSYHNDICKDQACVDYTKSTNSNIWLETNLGLNFSWGSFKSANSYAYNFRPLVGVNLRFIPFKSYYVWNVRTGLILSSNDLTGNFTNTTLGTPNYPIYIKLKCLIARIPFTIEYSFPGERKIQPFLALSYNNIFLYYTDYKTRYSGSPDISRSFTKLKYQMGFAFDLGFRYNLTSSKYLFCKNTFEYRRSGIILSDILDYFNIDSDMVSFGIGFTIN
jgi:hypothetical protein